MSVALRRSRHVTATVEKVHYVDYAVDDHRGRLPRRIRVNHLDHVSVCTEHMPCGLCGHQPHHVELLCVVIAILLGELDEHLECLPNGRRTHPLVVLAEIAAYDAIVTPLSELLTQKSPLAGQAVDADTDPQLESVQHNERDDGLEQLPEWNIEPQRARTKDAHLSFHILLHLDWLLLEGRRENGIASTTSDEIPHNPLVF